MGIFGSSFTTGSGDLDNQVAGGAVSIFAGALQKVGINSSVVDSFVPRSPTQVASVNTPNYQGAGAQAPQAISGSGTDITTPWYKKPITWLIAAAVVVVAVLVARR